MNKATINGIELAYRIDGEEAKPWMVVSNSLATDHRMWEPQMPALTHTHRVLRYDTRGHGQTEATAGNYSLDLLVSDAIGLMDHLHIQTADFLGLSLGGMTGLGLALDHPERVDRLVCCDARADSPDAYANGWRDRIEIARSKGLSALVEGTLERWFTDAYRSDPDNAQCLDDVRTMILSTSVDGFSGCAHALTKLNYKARLGNIKAPSLFLVGQDDMAAPPDVMREMAAAVPQHDFAIVENAAHLSNLNNATGFNDRLTDWLTSP